MRGVRTFPWVGAILFGALAPALLVGSLWLQVLPLAFMITLGHAVILGLPVALIYTAMRWTRLSTAIAGGFLIGAIPGGLSFWPVSLSLRTTESIQGVPTIVNGIPTLAGWIRYLELLGILGGLGAIGSIAFWLVLRWTGALQTIALNPPAPIASRNRPAVLILTTAIITSVAVMAIPSITKDRTCHNLFRDGRTFASPKVNIDLDIDLEDWPRFTTLLQQFGASHGMSFRNSSQRQPGTVEILGLSACLEEGLVITASEQRWAFQRYAAPIPGRGVPISVFDLGSDTAWQPLGQDLVATLDSEWPGKVRFRDGGGQLIPKLAALGAIGGQP